MIYLNNLLMNGKDDYFPDNTPAFNSLERFNPIQDNSYNTITWKYDNMGELFEIISLVDWIKSKYVNMEIDLNMDYIPNARMDRIKDTTDVFTLKTMCRLINDCKFRQVFVKSAHSNVSLALLNNVVNLEPIGAFLSKYGSNFDTIFLPDEGAVKRYTEIDKVKQYPIVYANKKRDWKTAKILGLDIVGNDEDIKNKRILFVDDIISRGGSAKFSAIALKERGAKSVEVFITHTENVIDIEMLKNAGITKVYTTDSIYRGSNDFVKIV